MVGVNFPDDPRDSLNRTSTSMCHLIGNRYMHTSGRVCQVLEIAWHVPTALWQIIYVEVGLRGVIPGLYTQSVDDFFGKNRHGRNRFHQIHTDPKDCEVKS